MDLTSGDEADSKDDQKASAPKKRGRPKGSKNKKNADPKKIDNTRYPRARKWTITGWFDKFDDAKEEKLSYYWDEDLMNYLCGQIEWSETTQRKHWQCFVQFKRPLRANKVLEIFPGKKWHNGIAYGSCEQNRDYCSAQPGDQIGKNKKTGRVLKDSFIEIGVIVKQGQEAGLARAAQMIHDGNTIKEIFEEVTETAIRHSNGIREVAEVLQTEDDCPEFGLDDFKDWADQEITDWTKTVVS